MTARSRGVAFGLCAVGLMVILQACAGAMGVRAGEADSPTGGLAMSLFITDGETQHALYRVDADGTIHFGGGFDALDNETTWQAGMSDADLTRLRALLEEHGWLTDPAPTGGEGDRHHRVRLAWPGGTQAFETEGGGPSIDPVREFLERVTARRYDEYLESLPGPGRLD